MENRHEQTASTTIAQPAHPVRTAFGRTSFDTPSLTRPHALAARVARIAVVALAVIALGAQGSELVTKTTRGAETAWLYDTYHDQTTNFVFVKLPAGWRFVGRDVGAASHAVFHDPATDFVFVKTATRWQFVGLAH